MISDWDYFNNKTFKVVTLEYPPFVIKNVSTNGSTEYRGLVVRLVNEIAQTLNFRIDWYEPADGQFGGVNRSGQWTGMVGEVAYGRADFAAGGLTINSERESVVDFSFPFWEESQGVLVMPTNDNKMLAAFNPFDTWLWLLLFGSVFITAAFVRLIAITSNLFMKIYEPLSVSYSRSVSFCFRAALAQSNVHDVKQQSTQAVLASWLFLCIVLNALYTGNLMASLTVKKRNMPFDSLAEMTSQSTYKYGVIEGHVIQILLKSAGHETYARLHEQMMKDPTNIVISDETGFERVRTERFALIGDETFLKMNASDNCKTSIIKETFYKSGFGCAFPPNWPGKKQFNRLIQLILEGGFFTRWKDQTFTNYHCNHKVTIKAQIVTLPDTVALFVILFSGIIIAIFVLIMENFRKWIW